MSELKCPICGEPTYMHYGHPRKDGLCAKHGQMANAKKIVQCEDCGKFHDADKPCDCTTPKKAHISQTKLRRAFTELPTEGFSKCVSCGAKTSGYAFCRDCFHEHTEDELLDILNAGGVIVDIEEAPQTKKDEPAPQEIADEEDEEETKKHPLEEGRCIICGYESGENFFCRKCYYRYRNKTLLVKITKCVDIELTDESYESIYKCDDGHMVKSTQELLIDNYLFNNGIRHAYEVTLTIDDNGTHIDLHPDFYLPDRLGPGKDVYIEHWGINEEDNANYKKTKKYKLALYKKHLAAHPEFTLITTDGDDVKDLSARLRQKLTYIQEGTIDGKKG